jgi:dTDP-glucose 4,6-dehydratase
MKNKKEKTICITGCLGFIGSHFVDLCLEDGWRVFGIDKCTYASNNYLIDEFSANNNFTFLKKDIRLLDRLPECDYIVNFAAESHVQNSIGNSDSFLSSNVIGVQNILNLISQKPRNAGERPVFIQISTDEVYGDIECGEHLSDDRLVPSNPYSASKAAADMLILAWGRTYDIKYNIIRPTNNYGIRQHFEKLIPLVVKNINRGRKICLHNGGEPIRNWLHVKDTAEGVMAVVKSDCENEIFNISGGFEQKNSDTVRAVMHAIDPKLLFEDNVELDQVREGQDVRYAVDDSKLRALGWAPSRVFAEEIGGIVDFFKDDFRW